MTSRQALLVASLVMLVVSLVLTMTPLAWDMLGRPSESYPELFFFLFCLPSSLLAVLDAMLLLWLNRESGRFMDGDARLIWAAAVLTLAGGVAGLVAFLVGVGLHFHAPHGFGHAVQWGFAHYHWIFTVPALVLTGVGVLVVVLSARAKRTPA